MSERLSKRYLFVSDFDQTLNFNDSGYALSELLGISTEKFEHKAAGMPSNGTAGQRNSPTFYSMTRNSVQGTKTASLGGRQADPAETEY